MKKNNLNFYAVILFYLLLSLTIIPIIGCEKTSEETTEEVIQTNIVLLNKNNIPIPQNTIIFQTGTIDSSELITRMNVKNNSTYPISVLCKKTTILLTDSTDLTMCWAGSCYPPIVNVSIYSQLIQPNQIITDFDGRYFPVYVNFKFRKSESIVRWTFFNENTPNDSASVTIKYIIS